MIELDGAGGEAGARHAERCRELLDRVFGAKLDRWASVLPKVLADQAVYAPVACGSFLAWAAVLKGGDAAEVKANAVCNLEHSFTKAWLADCSSCC